MLTIFCFNILNEKQDKMCLKIKKGSSLLDLRNILEQKRHFNSLYFLDSTKHYVSKELEKNIPLENYNKNIIYFTDVNHIKVNLGGEFLCNIDFKNIPVSELRVKLDNKINQKDKFFFNGVFILDEENFTVFEICQSNVIEITQISDTIYNKLNKDVIVNKEINISKENIQLSKKNEKYMSDERSHKCEKNIDKNENELIELIPNQDINIINKRDEKSNNMKSNIEIKNGKSMPLKRHKTINVLNKNNKYKVIFDDDIQNNSLFLEFPPDGTLKQIREKLPSEYKNYSFLYEGYPIIEEDEKISDIAKDNIINMKRNNDFKLDSYQKIEKKSIYEYYLYQNTEFNEEEEKECISILLLGETGVGKTTFLNSIINFILNVKYSDDFRFLLVNEKDTNYLSQTKNVNIYHIKSHNSFPPIKIIDTPGFGDTSGSEFDKKIVKMIFEKFKEIKELTSVCIICKYNEGRFDYSQRYVYNSIINLFGKNMAENFMILFSFCDAGKILSKQCFEEKDSPFYQIISRIKEPWYLKFNNSGFFSENQNNLIEEYFQMGMESYMALINKLKTLKKIRLEISFEANVKREKLDNITLYISRKIISLAKLMCNSSYINKDESLIIYYCPECNFFSDSNTCVVCNKTIDLDLGNKKYNFKGYKKNGDNLILKNIFEIYSNLFQLEKIMKEYNNISLKGSQETMKDFLSQVGMEENKNENIRQKIFYIRTNYEQLKNTFYNSKNNKNDFSCFLFSQLKLNK